MNPLKNGPAPFRYIWNILIAIDQLGNALLAGDPDETMSSRFGKWLDEPRGTWRWRIAYFICRLLHLLDKGHCEKTIELDEGANAVVRGKKK